ncbi:GntR family transcriptional regulator [Clostridium sp. DL1XJH146]
MPNKQIFYTISDQIVDKIRKEIIFGKLQEGAPLREQDLSDKYSVSRGPIRDALKILSKEGLLTLTPNVGVKVAPRPAPESHAFIIKIRKEIETFVIEKEFDNFTEDDFNEMNRILKRFQVACEANNLYSVFDLDIQFHSLIVSKYADNHILQLWLSALNRTMFTYGRLKNLMDSYYEHESILNAFKEGNKKLVIDLLNQNIQ